MSPGRRCFVTCAFREVSEPSKQYVRDRYSAESLPSASTHRIVKVPHTLAVGRQDGSAPVTGTNYGQLV